MAASVAQFGCSNKPQPLDRFAVLSQLDREEVDRICRQKGHPFRDVKLPPGKTVRCFGWQILMGNVSCDAVVHRSDGAFTASAYCQARQRLPLEVVLKRRPKSFAWMSKPRAQLRRQLLQQRRTLVA
jgi:hypothetical protein